MTSMVDHPDLADPAFEPTDAQLVELSQRAFAGVRQQNERALQGIRDQIAAARELVLRALAERRAGGQRGAP